MSVDSYLNALAKRLVLSDQEKESIELSIKTLKTRLISHFGNSILQQMQIGSSTRGTILPREVDSESDIDYMIVFDTSDRKLKPQTYLNQLKRFAQQYYSSSEIYQSSPTIVLSLNHISFELIPATNRVFFSGYKIPSPKSSWTDWTSTNPSKFCKELCEKDERNNGLILPLVRLVKYWNAQVDYPFYSYELEKHIVEMNFIFCSTLQDYFYKFWSRLDLNSYEEDSHLEIVDEAKECISNARKLARMGMHTYAIMEIQKIVGEL